MFLLFLLNAIEYQDEILEILVKFINNVSNTFLVQFWSLDNSSRIFYDFQKMLIKWLLIKF